MLRILSGSEFLANAPDAPWDFSDLSRLHGAVDEKCQKQEALGGVACRKGCHHCCRQIPTLLPVEYAFLVRNQEDLSVRPEPVEGPVSGRIPLVSVLRQAQHERLDDFLSGSPEGSRSASGVLLCSELHPGEPLCGHLESDGSCRIYGFRPLICRTHGFLHLSEEGLDHCPWNFQQLEEVDEDLPFRLETLHDTLLRVNLAFLRKSYATRWKDLAEVRIQFQ